MDRNAWIAAVTLVVSAAAQAAPFALITDLKGAAWATEGGKQNRLNLLGYIESPTEMKVDPATKVGITYFASGMQYTFDGPARIALDAKEPRVLEGKAAQPTRIGPDKAISGGLSNDQWRRLQQATVVMRSIKPAFSVVSPVDKTVLLSREPEFEWTPAADAKRYRLVIYGPDNKILHEATTDKTALQPGSAVSFQPGMQYRWKVDALGVAKPASTAGAFAVADDAARERIAATRPQDSADLPAHIFYVTSLESEGYLADARAEWKALARKHPDIPELKQRSN